MISRLHKFSSAQIWLLSIILSVVIIGLTAATTGILLKKEVTRENLLASSVAFLAITVLVKTFLTYFTIQQKRSKADIGLVNPASGVPGKIAATGTALRESAASKEYPPTAPPNTTNDRAKKEAACDNRSHSKLKQAIQNLEVLPAMPAIAQKLLSLNLNTEEGERMLLVLIAQDPQISAKIIGLANSALIGTSRHIISIRDAALLLGAKRVQSVAASIAIISLMAKAPQSKFKAHDLWLHGFRVAAAIQCIARYMPAKLRPSDEQIFLAGTLHDIGYLVLAHLDPELSDKLHTRLSVEPARPAIEIEHEILDICHDELGAELAHHWGLPEEIISALCHHHYPEEAGEGVGQILARMIDTAQKILQPISATGIAASGISAMKWELLGISPIKEEEIKEEVNIRAAQATQFANSFF